MTKLILVMVFITATGTTKFAPYSIWEPQGSPNHSPRYVVRAQGGSHLHCNRGVPLLLSVSVAVVSRPLLPVFSSGANAMVTPVSVGPTRLVSWLAAVSTTPREWTASVVCPSSRTGRGPVAPQRMPTSVCVSVPQAVALKLMILAEEQSPKTSQWGVAPGWAWHAVWGP